MQQQHVPHEHIIYADITMYANVFAVAHIPSNHPQTPTTYINEGPFLRPPTSCSATAKYYESSQNMAKGTKPDALSHRSCFSSCITSKLGKHWFSCCISWNHGIRLRFRRCSVDLLVSRSASREEEACSNMEILHGCKRSAVQ